MSEKKVEGSETRYRLASFFTQLICVNEKKRGLRYSPAPIERCVEVVLMETSLLRVVAALPSL